MILFFSDYCPYCRTLLEEIKRKDSRQLIKLASVEGLRAAKRVVPPQIHSVPALMDLSTKRLVFGRQVFDALFLPGSGALVSVSATAATASAAAVPAGPSEPEPFVLGASMSDTFSSIQDDDMQVARATTYSTITEQSGLEMDRVGPPAPATDGERGKKRLPNMDDLQRNRDMDLKNYLSVEQMPNPLTTR